MKFSFLLHLMLIFLELIPFKFDDLSTQIWWTILCNVKDLDSILFKILNSLMCGLANFHLKFRLLWNFHRIYQDVQIYYLCPFPFCIFLFFFFFGWMILIYVAYCIALLLTTSIFYMGCQWTLIITIGYYLKNTLFLFVSLCASLYFFFLNNFGLVIKKVQGYNTYDRIFI